MQKDRTETAELLLKLGADVNARNWRGQTPLYYTQREQNPRYSVLGRVDPNPVAALLRSRGENIQYGQLKRILVPDIGGPNKGPWRIRLATLCTTICGVQRLFQLLQAIRDDVVTFR